LWVVVWDSVGHMRSLRLLATNADDGFLSLDAPVFMPRHKSSLKALHITPPFPNTHSYAGKKITDFRCQTQRHTFFLNSLKVCNTIFFVWKFDEFLLYASNIFLLHTFRHLFKYFQDITDFGSTS